jgi:hypothetical protein
MESASVPSADEVIDLLHKLQQYRATLMEPAQLLLDSLVSTGLGRTPDQPRPDETRALWRAYASHSFGASGSRAMVNWEATPWGRVYCGRYQL